jgi:hypothetical protein
MGHGQMSSPKTRRRTTPVYGREVTPVSRLVWMSWVLSNVGTCELFGGSPRPGQSNRQISASGPLPYDHSP